MGHTCIPRAFLSHNWLFYRRYILLYHKWKIPTVLSVYIPLGALQNFITYHILQKRRNYNIAFEVTLHFIPYLIFIWEIYHDVTHILVMTWYPTLPRILLVKQRNFFPSGSSDIFCIFPHSWSSLAIDCHTQHLTCILYMYLIR